MQLWQKLGDPTVLVQKFGKSLVSQQFRNPRSGEVEEYITFGQKDWSIVLTVTENSKVLLVSQYKQGCDKVITELPAGTADFEGEAPEVVIRRELLQETGFEASKIIAVGPPQWIASRSSWTRFHPFLAVGCHQVAQPQLDVTEQIETAQLPLSDWIGRVLNGRVDEPSSIVTTFLALPFLDITLQYPEA
jgi:ADP-ribose pyrophosphatase